MAYQKPFAKSEYAARVQDARVCMRAESFVVTENGGERLCDVQRSLVVID